MQYKDLKEKAKNLGMRVTKDVRGKRVKLTSNELRARIRLNFENSVKNAQQVIRVCKTIIVPSNQGTSRIPPPPPPPPPPPREPVPRNPVVNVRTRAKLMAELKNTLKKRALKK